jgi:putative toxin-antitoxin system antitoxin component (TIGR02293 family)
MKGKKLISGGDKHLLKEPAITYSVLDDRDALKLINAIKKGINYSFFERLAKNIPFTLREWSSFLHLSERSLQRYKKDKGVFNAITSERIIEITMLNKYGIEVFGDQERFNTWLATKSPALGGIKPKDLLDSTFGIQMLKDELTRIEHGVLA